MDTRVVTHQTTADDEGGVVDTRAALEIEGSPDGVLVAHNDWATATYNRRFAEMWALPPGGLRDRVPDSVLGLVLAKLKDPVSFSSELLRFRANPETAVHREVELLDGRFFECNSGAIQGTAAERRDHILFFRDVTELRRSESRLRASHALLATTERIAHVGGWEWDLTRDVLSWSEETCRMFGRDPRTHVPTVADFVSAIHPDDRQRVQDAIDESVRSNKRYEVEFRVVRSDGVERDISAEAEITLDANGKAARMTGTTHDVTAQKTIEKGLRFANALFTAQLESSPDGILVVGADRRIVSFNQKFLAMWNVPEEIVESRSDERAVGWVLESISDPAAFVSGLEDLYAHPDQRSHGEVELKDGRVFERHSSPLPIAAGERPGRIFFFRDISARKRAEDGVVRMARLDGLTGLPNRDLFVGVVKQAIALARRGGKGFALLYLDLDHFKDVNDALGHPAGDLLLRETARRLQATVREPDLVARFGGDEFAVIESNVTEPTEAAALAARLQDALREPFPILGNEIRIGVSIGIAIHSSDTTGAESLLSQADLALYRAKSDGRGTYCFFAKGMDAEVRERVALVSELRVGLAAGQIFLVYQPQVEVATGRIIGVEALARWRHPRLGLVGPGLFIPVAEKSGLIVPLGRWVLGQACRQAKLWIDAGIGPAIVGVNVSGAQFRTPLEFETTLAAILADTGLPPDRLELELTESVLMTSEQRDTLSHLRQLGVEIAIDDFGTGFSSLQYLSRFPVDRIKIAQEFVKDLVQFSGNAAIVKATIGLGRDLGLQVIAEGVETAEQLALLEGWGCREVQGYYFAKPMSVDEIEDLLRKGRIDPHAS